MQERPDGLETKAQDARTSDYGMSQARAQAVAADIQWQHPRNNKHALLAEQIANWLLTDLL